MDARPFRILVTARAFCATPGPHQDYLRANGCELVLDPPRQAYSAAELAARLADIDGVILGLDACDATVFERASALRTIARYGVGVDNIDRAAAARHGVIVTNTPGTNHIAVAELAIGLLFALARGIPRMNAQARTGTPTRLTGWELTGKTLGVIGFGAIGREVARRAHGLGMRVLAHDPWYTGDWEDAQPVDLPDLLCQARAVSLHCPLTPETASLLNARTLALLPDGAVVINTARGGLIDEDALYAELVSGRLGGAALDVFAHEPPASSPLLTLDNVIVTPHAGAATVEAVERTGLLAARNCLAVLRGEPCDFIVPFKGTN